VVDRIVRLGFEVRVELTLADGNPVSVQLPRAEAEELELREGDIVYVRAAEPPAADVFAGLRPRLDPASAG
jgi:sulfate/thiosulfate transport system ATP-binding protein